MRIQKCHILYREVGRATGTLVAGAVQVDTIKPRVETAYLWFQCDAD